MLYAVVTTRFTTPISTIYETYLNHKYKNYAHFQGLELRCPYQCLGFAMIIDTIV